MIIDWQHHFVPQELVNRRGGAAERPRREGDQADKHLEWMNAAGIDIAVLTSGGNTLEDCKTINDAYGNMMKEHPNRFVGLAACIPTLGDENQKELDRAINVLGLRGVCIGTQTERNNVDSDIFWPFYEMVYELDIPIFVHVGGPSEGLEAFDAKHSKYALHPTLGFMTRDQSSTASIILGGILAKFPDLKIVVSHMGGGISAIKDRFHMVLEHFGRGFWTNWGGTAPFDEPFEENFTKYFNKVYFDMAGYEGRMSAVKCALININPERLLFATDYPPNFRDPQKARDYIDNIRKLDLPSESIELILGGTAAKLLSL